MSDSQSHPSPNAEDIFAEYLARTTAGEKVDFEVLCALSVERAAELRVLKSQWDALAPILKRIEHHESLSNQLKKKFGEGIDPGVSLEGNQPDADLGPTSELLRRLQEHGPKSERYKILGEFARGGMGAILRVWDEDLRRTLAMKVVLGREDPQAKGGTPLVEPKTLGRFLEEAQVTGQLDHPGIVPVHELGLSADGRVYFTMRLVKGRDLKHIFGLVREERDGWNQTRALGVLLKVCEAMSYAHDKGVIHRDLKPANVMVGKYGEVYVMDWGLARVLGKDDKHDLRIKPQASTQSVVKTERHEQRDETPDSPLVTMDGDVVGTPSYMPPEQAKGQLDQLGAWSDVYSLGAMLYQLLSGDIPFVPAGTRMSQHTILLRLIEGPPKPLFELAQRAPAELIAICDKAMARDPLHRYRDMQELANDLRAFLEQRVVKAYEAGAWAEARKWVARNKPLAASIAAAGLLLVAGASGIASVQAAGRKKAEILASSNLALADEARKSAAFANSEALLAKEAAELANMREREARWNLYVADITGAQSARRINEPATMRKLLDSAPEELRNWEWRYFDSTSDTSVLKIPNGNKAWFSPDGARIINLLLDKTVQVVDAASGQELQRLRLDDDVSAVCASDFDPDGQRIVLASFVHAARVLDAVSGKEIAQLDGDVAATCLDFSPDGGRVVMAWFFNHPQAYDALVCDVVSGKELARIVDQDGNGPYTAKFSPDGNRIITAGPENTAHVWDAASGDELARFEHASSVIFAAFSLDGTCIVTTARDNIVRVWDVESGEEVVQFKGHGGEVYSAAYSPDGTRIVTASNDNTARVWDVATGNELARLEGHTDGVYSAGFSPNGALIVTSSHDGTARVWDALAKKKITPLDFAGNEFTAPNGHRYPVDLRSAAFNSDGTSIVTEWNDATVRMWDVASGNEPVFIKRLRSLACCVSLSADSKRIVASLQDGSAVVWDAANGNELARLEGHSGIVFSAAFSPDGTRITTAAEDKTARVWDAASGKELVRLDGHTDEVRSAAFSPDGTRIVTTSSDRTARIWDAMSGKELARFDGLVDFSRSSVFSSDGASIVTTSVDHGACVWDAASGHQSARLVGHTDVVLSAVFSPDSTRIVTVSSDQTVRVWDAITGKELARLEGHTEKVLTAAFSPDGTRLFTASGDRTVRVWDSIPYHVRFRGR